MKLQFKTIQFILFISILVLPPNISKVYAQEETIPVNLHFFFDGNEDGIHNPDQETYSYPMELKIKNVATGEIAYEGYFEPIGYLIEPQYPTFSISLPVGEYYLNHSYGTPLDDSHGAQYFTTDEPYSLIIEEGNESVDKEIGYYFYDPEKEVAVTINWFNDLNSNGLNDENDWPLHLWYSFISIDEADGKYAYNTSFGDSISENTNINHLRMDSSTFKTTLPLGSYTVSFGINEFFSPLSEHQNETNRTSYHTTQHPLTFTLNSLDSEHSYEMGYYYAPSTISLQDVQTNNLDNNPIFVGITSILLFLITIFGLIWRQKKANPN